MSATLLGNDKNSQTGKIQKKKVFFIFAYFLIFFKGLTAFDYINHLTFQLYVILNFYVNVNSMLLCYSDPRFPTFTLIH